MGTEYLGGDSSLHCGDPSPKDPDNSNKSNTGLVVGVVVAGGVLVVVVVFVFFYCLRRRAKIIEEIGES